MEIEVQHEQIEFEDDVEVDAEAEIEKGKVPKAKVLQSKQLTLQEGESQDEED